MQKHLAIGRGVKVLDYKKTEGGGVNEPPPAILRVNNFVYILTNNLIESPIHLKSFPKRS